MAALQNPAAAPPAEALLLVVDMSGSMNESNGVGGTRIESARGAIDSIVSTLPESLAVGLRVYGHRVPSTDRAAACQDTELVVPVATGDKGRITSTLAGLQPKGETPIGLSLQHGAADLPAGVPGTIILVSDGLDECFPALGTDPCTVATGLATLRPDLRIETIGLQVAPQGADQLRCIAEATGAQFTEVRDAGKLADALAAARVRTLRTFVPRGRVAAGGPSLIDATPVTPGVYQDTILDGETLWYAVDAARGQELTARLTMATGGIDPKASIGLLWSDENAERIAAEVLPTLSRGQANTLAVATGPIDGARSPLGARRDEGTYFLSIETARFPSGAEHAFVLEITASGQDVATPGASDLGPLDDPTATAGTGPPVALSAPTAAAAPPPLPPPPSNGSTAPVVLTLVALLLAGGGAAAYLLLRHRSSREAPPEAPPTY